MSNADIISAYEKAKQAYAKLGVDTDAVIEKFKTIEVSVHCWQGDDVKGFEGADVASQNVVTGNYPGAARTPDELRADLDKALNMSPMKHKVNLHAIYGDDGKSIDRDKMTVKSFDKWIAWAKERNIGLDFNDTFFAHENMTHDMSLSNPDDKIRKYWVEHAKACRAIGAEMGKQLGKPCVLNLWIPDGLKDTPADKGYYRNLLKESLDEIYSVKYDKKYLIDAMEGKLFGIGTESYVVGSYDFYLAYAVKNGLGICLDMGHYHPTEKVSDKISAVAPFVDNILLHVSRGVRWDSDHVVVLDDELNALFKEINRGDLFPKVSIGLDYFDATINRVMAWQIGIRAAARAILNALLEPTDMLRKAEREWDFSSRLAIMEELKGMPANAVFDYICMKAGVPVGFEWIDEAKAYEKKTLAERK